MSDSAVAVTAGSGTNIDTRTEATNGNHRQVVVLGDPATNAGVAPVDATNGLSVSITNASLTVASHAVTNAGTFPVQAAGDIAHDAADSGAPVKVGAVAIAHGTNPTAVAAADRTNLYANRAGIPFIIGGHPNVICKGHLIADSDGAQTDAALIGSISSGTKIVVTRLSAICDNANTGDCAITIGFGATNTPSPSLSGVTGVLVNGAFDGGAGVTLGDGSGIIGVGGDGEELRITCSDPAGGNIRVSYSYYTIES